MILIHTDLEKEFITILNQWKDDHPEIECFVSPPNMDDGRHIMLWRGDDIWIGPDYNLSKEEFEKMLENPTPFLNKAYTELLIIEERQNGQSNA